MSKLKKIREAEGISQTLLAARLRVGQGTVSEIENGKRYAWPKLRRRMARILGVRESELFDERGRVLEVGDEDE